MYQSFKDFVGPVATIIAAVVAASVTGYFAWRQWKTAENRLRFELFEKRLKVYLATKTLVDTIIVHGSSNPDDLQQFYSAIEGAEFLFKDDLRKFYMEIAELCWRARMARLSQEKTKNEEQINNLMEKEDSIVDLVTKKGETLEREFREYLDLSRIGL